MVMLTFRSVRTSPFAFDYGENAIYTGNGYLFYGAAGPVNFQFVDRGGVSQPEMDARIGAGAVAAAAEDIGALAEAAGREEDLRSNGIAGALRAAKQFQGEPVIRI